MENQFTVTWEDHGREPTCKPDPRYPDGIDLSVCSPGEPSCTVPLPYPAKRCGVFFVRCTLCDFSVGLTTAGRPDDPRSIKIPCRLQPGKPQ